MSKSKSNNQPTKKYPKYGSREFVDLYEKISSNNITTTIGHIADERAMRLGQVIDRFQRIDATLDSIIESFTTNNTGITSILINGLPFGRKIDALMAINQEANSNDASLKTLLKEAKKAEEMRNALFHSFWLDSSKDEIATAHKTSIRKGQLDTKYTQYPTSDLTGIVNWFNAINIALIGYRNLKHFGALQVLNQ